MKAIKVRGLESSLKACFRQSPLRTPDPPLDKVEETERLARRVETERRKQV